MQPHDNTPYGYCHCGCGQKTTMYRGEPRQYIHNHHTKRPLAERFWEKADKSGGDDACWLWQASTWGAGYGVFGSPEYGTTHAHRVAYLLTHGSIPDGLSLDHLCRNPSCVNPAHLEPVTAAENFRRGHRPRGDECSFSKVTSSVVVEMRELHKEGWTPTQIGAKFGVSMKTVWNIVHRRSWKHIPPTCTERV